MKQIRECPECKLRLHDMDLKIQHREICGYRARKGIFFNAYGVSI
ncbi:hypothetical protein [Methanolobus sp.]|nr:hypothetical protein [Methanolobus sp.]